jgi:hypothetical protein
MTLRDQSQLHERTRRHVDLHYILLSSLVWFEAIAPSLIFITGENQGDRKL